MKYVSSMFLVIVILAAFSCAGSQAVPLVSQEPVVIYKTRVDYRDHISVQLSDDGKSILAYPAPSDVLMQKPVELVDGYLLKRMQGNAFLSLTIDAYADTAQDYSVEDLLTRVVDSNPYSEIYDCSDCVAPDTASINTLIRKGKLKNCKPLH